MFDPHFGMARQRAARFVVAFVITVMLSMLGVPAGGPRPAAAIETVTGWVTVSWEQTYDYSQYTLDTLGAATWQYTASGATVSASATANGSQVQLNGLDEPWLDSAGNTCTASHDESGSLDAFALPIGTEPPVHFGEDGTYQLESLVVHVPTVIDLVFCGTTTDDPETWQWDVIPTSGPSAIALYAAVSAEDGSIYTGLIDPQTGAAQGTFEINESGIRATVSWNFTNTGTPPPPPPDGDNVEPIAILRGLATDWRGPYTLAFTGVGSYDVDGTVVSWSWSFGDGSTAVGRDPTHQYLGPGTFTVQLTVVDDEGASGVTFHELTITGDPFTDFAPEIRLHPEEEHYPMDPGDFIAHSDLRWASDIGCPDGEAIEADPDPSRLGQSRRGGYGARQLRPLGLLCREFGPTYYGGELTRPFTEQDRPRHLGLREGFYLDFDAEFSPSSFTPVPVWFEFTPDNDQLAVTYWLFYGRSIPRRDGVGLSIYSHEGDWEHVNVRLDPITLVPEQIGYFAHHGGEALESIHAVEVADIIHPVVYSANTGHGSSPIPGTIPFCDTKFGIEGCLHDEFSDGGDKWQPWKAGGVNPVTAMPGYGFGGAWGAAGTTADTTGPLGPSIWKDPLGAG